MTIIPLRRRLADLEARSASLPEPPRLHPLAVLFDALIAFHLGGCRYENGGDSLAAGVARGLGYATTRDLDAALLAPAGSMAAEDLTVRYDAARERLFALHGASMGCDGATFVAVLEALFFAMPERLQRHPCFEDFDAVAFFRDEGYGFPDPLIALIGTEPRP